MSNVGEGLESDEIFEDVPLEFNPAYPSMDRWTRSHPKEQVLSDPQVGIMTRAHTRAKNEVLNVHPKFCMFNVFILKMELKTVKVALEDPDWIVVMQSELAELERNKVWRLVPKPNNVSVIGLKWIYKNKTEKEGNVVRRKARLVVKGYSQHDGID